MTLRLLAVLCASILVTSCATKSQFVYEHSAEGSSRGLGEERAEVAPVLDKRQGKKEMDEVYVASPLKEIQEIIREELLNTGLFKSVVTTASANTGGETDVFVEASLRKLDWGVPNYEDKLGTAFVVSMLTGGIGGIAYGSTTTQVYADTSIQVRITDKSTGNVLVEKTYNGRVEESMALMKSDTPETKATIVGKSLKVALQQMTADLKRRMKD